MDIVLVPAVLEPGITTIYSALPITNQICFFGVFSECRCTEGKVLPRAKSNEAQPPNF